MRVARSAADLPSDRPLYIFGAGEGGRIALAAIRERPELRPAAFIDNARAGTLEDLPILTLAAFLAERPGDAAVVLASQYWAEIAAQLDSVGVKAAWNLYPLIRDRTRDGAPSPEAGGSAEYWSRVNVTGHRVLADAEESFRYLDWRNLQYLGLEELMPTAGHDGLVVLDYGCGPGHDLVGFLRDSRPARLIAMDVSPASLAEARHRLGLHGAEAEWMAIREADPILPLADGSVDLIHCSGVLHHVPDPVGVLREFRRILAPGGVIQVMVYNRDSVFLHLHVAYLESIVAGRFPGLTVEEAFRRSTDGPNCPISVCYTPSAFIALAAAAGLEARFVGAAVCAMEMAILPRRFDALQDARLAVEHRRFLYGLRFDDQGCPIHNGARAGLDACFRIAARS